MFKENPKLKNIFLLGFLLSLHLAFTSYISSSFLSVFSGEKNVGLIYVLSSIILICALSFVPRIFRKFGEYRFLLWSSGLNAVLLFLLSISKSSSVIIPVFIFYFTLNTLIVFALDELLQILSKNSSTGHVRGLYLAIGNMAWVISQFISGKILSQSPLSFSFFIAFAIMTLFFLVAFLSLRNVHDPRYDKTPARQSLRRFFANKNLARAYAMNFLLQFFYVWMIIYTPIYLYSHLHFSWQEISFIFSIMLIPFVLIQFPLGGYSDKIGEKKMLLFGFAIISLATLSLFFIEKHEIWTWAIALFTTRIGAAIIEVMSDVYFFKHINKENDEFIAVYRNTSPMAYVFAPLFAFAVFYFTPSFNYIFLVLGAIMFFGVYLSSTIKKSDI
ncbi:MAG: MFS transporter [Candidatus Nomurabacteria bacterium]|nr:MFS transporter [Candidatus Nomurabacteria bacterium]